MAAVVELCLVQYLVGTLRTRPLEEPYVEHIFL